MRFNNLVAIHRATSARDAYNEDTLTWSLLAEEWAGVRWGAGNERRSAAAVSAPQAATFILRENERTRGLRVTDRIVFDGSAWNVGGIVHPKPGEIEVTAVRDAAEAVAPVANLNPGDTAPSGPATPAFDDLQHLP